MKKNILYLSMLAVAILLSACSKNNSGSNTANVMFVNGSTGTTQLSVTANNGSTPVAGDIPFMGASSYEHIAAGTAVPVSFELVSLGGSTPFATGTINITAGNNYSVFASGILTSPKFFYTSDDLSAPTSGDAKVRFVNLSPDTISLSCSVTLSGTSTSTNIGTGLTSGTTSTFVDVPSGTYKVSAEDPANTGSTIAVLSPEPTFAAGKIYTIIYTGTSAGSGTSAYTLTSISNN